MSRFVCTITRTIYGHSGNELPPPRTGGETFIMLSEPDESADAFGKRMAALVLPYRLYAESQPVPFNGYGQRDGWGWSITELKSLPPLE